ncbi:uncharacterized protein STEHIDRAFT_172908 [Stereum hirsutum FP-91666 SS1]|uniref:N-acetyltransferase domain-containing protein n=1 Tax=Stereum hirsutum (strain FP-91666) TaxID=721885 RepID=R7RYD3_STEHR|nr:uncharacterized protein STEHIDRAFT_172908 [Stereum hirsutum FP-91666 SS1]EIM79910.1 hypothetical protein STEHIDRAFT_172908 [Stereum hirsutum FP-91666 SS1]
MAIASNIEIRLVDPKNISDAQIQDATNVWIEAFQDNPLFRALTNADASLYTRYMHSTLLAALNDGQVYFATSPSSPGTGFDAACGGSASASKDRLIGVAAWYPPGMAPGLLVAPDDGDALAENSKTKIDDGFETLFADFPPQHHTWWFEYFIPKKKSHTSLTLGKDGKQASWNLQMIGVRPEAQRRGVARQLIEFVYQNVAKSGEKFCLETDEEPTVEVYKKLGFSIVGEPEEYHSPVTDFKIWVMARTKD